jgi:hypothetical protein
LPAGHGSALRTVSLLVRALLLSGAFSYRYPEAAFERPLFLIVVGFNGFVRK